MNIITKLNIRQKIMLGLTILAALFLGWQVYNFVHSQTKAATTTSSSTANANSANANTTAPAAATSPAAPAQANAGVLPPPQTVNRLPPSVTTNPYAEMEQRQYLDLVRQYQLTKMKRQILEEEAGAANAQKTIADSSKNPAFQGSGSFTGYTPSPRTGYQLAYLDRQAGQWVATLNQNGQYVEVREGSTLNNGWQVISITRSGVIISNGERQRNLDFQGGENTDTSPPGYAVSNQSPPANLPSPPQATQAVQVKNIAQALGMTPGVAPAPVVTPTPGVPAAKGVALPNNNGLTIKPQSAKTAADVIKDVPAAPLTSATPAAAPASAAPAVTPAAQPVISNPKPAIPKPAVQPIIITTAPVQKIDNSKNSNNNSNNVNTNQNSKPTLNQKIMEKAPLPASVKNISGPVDQAPATDAVIPAPTASTNNATTNTMKNSSLPAPEVSAAAEANANQQAGKAVSVKDLQKTQNN